MWLHLTYFVIVCVVSKHVESICIWFYFLELLLWIDCCIGCEGLFRELVQNLVVVHPLSNCRDTLGLEKEIWKPWKEGRSSSPFLHNHQLERKSVLHAMFSLIS